jgi:cbb3-type cytochrome oxidase cytochrome c subunit
VQLFRRGILFGAALAAASLGKVSTARAQEAIKADAALAEQGAKVWKSKSCDGCHTIGKGKRAGPDLAGVTTRRTEAWLTQWLKNPPDMAKSDPVAKEMVKAAQGVQMPDFHLKDGEIAGLINYMAREGSK